ncbi:MAG: HAD family hydrolase [Acidobacteriota bacterium]|nr:HAD family hydrolase [Acidobacteriota bacterium]
MVAGASPNRAVFLDRDGVINQPTIRNGKSYPPDRVEDFQLIDGVAEACTLLKEAGFQLVVVTNQPDVRTGKQTATNVEAMHARLRDLLPLDDILACFHVDADDCSCRKPKPGMLLQAAEQHHIDLTRSYMVGDRWRDILAGQRAGCACYFVDYDYKEARPEGAYRTVDDLYQAARQITAGHPLEHR